MSLDTNEREIIRESLCVRPPPRVPENHIEDAIPEEMEGTIPKPAQKATAMPQQPSQFPVASKCPKQGPNVQKDHSHNQDQHQEKGKGKGAKKGEEGRGGVESMKTERSAGHDVSMSGSKHYRQRTAARCWRRSGPRTSL